MSTSAGFAEVDITPIEFPIRTYFSSADHAMDPIYAHAAIFKDDQTVLGILSFDVVIVEREYVDKIREAVRTINPDLAANLMVCATHNHACPAVVDRPGSDRDDEYLAFMIERGVEAVQKAYISLEPVEIGFASGFENNISFNRRFVRKNGTVISQPSISVLTDDILCGEAVIDPEVGVLCVRDGRYGMRGVVVNFACHACHHMGNISGGYPGVLYKELKDVFGEGCTI